MHTEKLKFTKGVFREAIKMVIFNIWHLAAGSILLFSTLAEGNSISSCIVNSLTQGTDSNQLTSDGY